MTTMTATDVHQPEHSTVSWGAVIAGGVAAAALSLLLLALGVGLTNVSTFFKRVSLALFALFFLGFLALIGFAYLLGEAFNAGARAMLVAATMVA